jgi:hypothetical protein
MHLWQVGGLTTQLEVAKYLIDFNQQRLDTVSNLLTNHMLSMSERAKTHRPLSAKHRDLKEEAQVIDLCDSDVEEVAIVKSE